MSRACPFRTAVAADLSQGPAWARSFQDCKSVVAAMIADGEVDRVAPPGGRFRNMIALTEAGAVRYFGRKHGLRVVRSRGEERDLIAEFIAEGGSLADAARDMGLSYYVAQTRWREICEALGPQAVA